MALGSVRDGSGCLVLVTFARTKEVEKGWGECSVAPCRNIGEKERNGGGPDGVQLREGG
jgi:hypothetical protein